MILDLFRLTSAVLAAGDRLVAPLGLTSARWQVLGAIVSAERPQPVAWLARDLGGNRQNVQRIINDLREEGLVEFEHNPHHRRAQLVALTEKGKKSFGAAMELQAPWVNQLSDGIGRKELEGMHHVIQRLQENLKEIGSTDMVHLDP